MSILGKVKNTVAATAGALVAINGFLHYEMMNRNATLPMKRNKKKYGDPEIDPALWDRNKWYDSQQFQEFTIKNSRDQRLKGYYLPAQKETKLFVFCSHGYRSTAKSEFNLIAKFYHDLGVNVFLVDHQASGQSQGNMISFGYYEKDDCMEWLYFMMNKFGADIDIILHGVSMGAATVLLMSDCKNLPQNVKFIVGDCSYSTMKGELSEFYGNIVGLLRKPVLVTTNIVNKIVSGFDYDDVQPIKSVKNAKVPVLFVHGGADTFIPMQMTYDLYNACGSDKDILIIEGADHAESFIKDPEVYGEKIKEFIDKYIGK